jgi:tRNA dimethylallyltransferase
LQQQLKELDLQTYNTIALDNPQRVIRALEICIGTKLPYSSFLGKAREKRKFNSVTIGLHADRQKIYDRINYRVDLMIAQGLLKEAKLLYSHRNLNALQTVGYKEFFSFFDGEITKEFAIEEIKKNSRRFAKRQLTWLRKNPDIIWFDFEEDSENIIKSIEAFI